jgi:hypothetical protein
MLTEFGLRAGSRFPSPPGLTLLYLVAGLHDTSQEFANRTGVDGLTVVRTTARVRCSQRWRTRCAAKVTRTILVLALETKS